jgi:hypothetical protein
MRKKVLINGIIILWAVASGIAVTMGPWRVYGKQKAQSEERVRAMNIAEEKGIKLLEAEDRAQSSIGREEAVRNAGYVGPGESPSNPEKK